MRTFIVRDRDQYYTQAPPNELDNFECFLLLYGFPRTVRDR